MSSSTHNPKVQAMQLCHYVDVQEHEATKYITPSWFSQEWIMQTLSWHASSQLPLQAGYISALTIQIDSLSSGEDFAVSVWHLGNQHIQEYDDNHKQEDQIDDDA